MSTTKSMKYGEIEPKTQYQSTTNTTTTKMQKNEIIISLEEDLKRTKKEQITDIWADLPTRIGRYVKIQLIKYTLNKYKL